MLRFKLQERICRYSCARGNYCKEPENSNPDNKLFLDDRKMCRSAYTKMSLHSYTNYEPCPSLVTLTTNRVLAW